MKYIRTKDGMLLSKETFDNSDYYLGYEEEILKQADTIEELCDAYIGIYKETIHIVSLSKELETLQDCKIIYGAIWTDKGLIYVAKMNVRGELELLWND